MKSYSTSLVMNKMQAETMKDIISSPLHQQKFKSHTGIVNEIIEQ